MIYVNPQPNDEEINNIYNEDYFSGGYDFGRQKLDYVLDDKIFKIFPQFIINLLNKKLPKKGKLLDIGCATGYLLETARDSGWEISGIEISEYARKIAEKKLNISIHNSLGDLKIKENYFDVITALEVIEHVTDPSRLLMEIRPYIKNGGLLVITTPNLKNSELYKSFLDWECVLPPVHLSYFSIKTITKMLEKNGYQVIDISYGPTNIFKSTDSRHVKNLKKVYYKIKPVIEPLKRKIIDAPISWYGRKKGIGESMIIFAMKK
jgi:SAM-dependent methyltransferase